jgi:hypothetical protein
VKRREVGEGKRKKGSIWWCEGREDEIKGRGGRTETSEKGWRKEVKIERG